MYFTFNCGNAIIIIKDMYNYIEIFRIYERIIRYNEIMILFSHRMLIIYC